MSDIAREVRPGRAKPGLSWPVATLALAAAVFLSGRLSIALISHDGRLAPVWIANTVALTALIRAPRRWWPMLVAGAIAGNLVMSLSVGNSPAVCLSMAVANAIEYSLGALVIRRFMPAHGRMDGGYALGGLAIIAAGVGVLAATVAAVLLKLSIGDDPVATFRTWGLAHPLSLLLLTPCFLVLTGPSEETRQPRSHVRPIASLLVLGACIALVFGQDTAPILFLIPPALLLVAVEVGTKGAAAGVLLTAFVAVGATSHNLGPVALMHADATERMAVLQLFLVISLGSSLPVAKLQARQRKLQAATRAEAQRAQRAEAAASESEERYRLLAESVNDMLAVTSPVDSRVLFVSQASEDVLGYAPEELIGRPTMEMTHPDDRVEVLRFFEELIAAGPNRKAKPYQFRGRHKDGSWRWLEGQPRVLFDASGVPLRFQDVVRDITARKTLEAELRFARAEAEAAAEVKSQFLANMSHELRTPLTAVIGFATLIHERPELSDLTRQYVARVQTAGKALLSTVNDVLEFSKLEAGQVEICPAPTDPALLAREVMQLFEAQAHAKRLALRTEAETSLPSCLNLDPERVRQVLTNLVGNAIKFTEAGSVTLQLSYEAGQLHAAVRDTGMGVAPEQASLLFQRFSQVDASNTRRHGGTGLGLAICKGLVEAMGGTIGLTSTPGHGSTFAFALPAAAMQQAEPALEPASQPRLDARSRVLLAEDNPVNRELVKALLAPHDLQLAVVTDGAEAVELASLEPFDLILMDLHMPNLDGRQAAWTLRSGGGPNAATTILAFSADVLDQELAPFDGMIAKPIVPRALFATLAHHLDGLAGQAERRAVVG